MELKPEETWQGQFEGAVDWVRNLPTLLRLTRIPILGNFISRGTFVGDPDSKSWMVPVQETVPVPDSVHMPIEIIQPLIEKAAFIGKAKECMCRRAFECKDHPHDVACLFLGTAFEHGEAHGLVMLTPDEALEHMQHAIGIGLTPTLIWEKEINTNFKAPMNKGLAICVCCDCCCDMRLALRLGGHKFRKKVFRPEGVTVVVSDDCDLLGDCAVPDVCSVSAISLGPTKAEIDLEKCVGCGHCVQVCPIEAISFEFDPEVDIVGSLISQIETYTTIT